MLPAFFTLTMAISFEKLKPKVSLDFIFSQISDDDILRKWCPEFPSRSFKSPFRKDKEPSFGFFKSGNKWLWKDLGNGDTGDAIDYVMAAERVNISDALIIIAESFNLAIGFSENRIIRSSVPKADYSRSKERALIQAIRKEPTNFDYEYWNSNLINPQIMRYLDIRCAKEIWLKRPEWKEKKILWTAKENNPIYYWLSPFSNNLKAYRPFEPDKKKKWVSNMNDLTDIQGYMQCRIKQHPNRPLILTKSMKEIGFFRAFGINAMAPNAEGYHLNPDFVRHIKKYCHPIISLYDSDIAGVKGMINIKDSFGIPGLVIPKSFRKSKRAKDPTDIWQTNYKDCYKLIDLIHEYIEFERTKLDNATFGFRYS
jgi:hypothetical protein